MEVEISFKLLLKSLFKHLWTILLIVLVVAILTAVYTYFFMTPVYMAKTASNLLVNDLNATQGSNLNTTIGMMSTYATKVKSDETMQTASNMIAKVRFPPKICVNSSRSVLKKTEPFCIFPLSIPTL